MEYVSAWYAAAAAAVTAQLDLTKEGKRAATFKEERDAEERERTTTQKCKKKGTEQQQLGELKDGGLRRRA